MSARKLFQTFILCVIIAAPAFAEEKVAAKTLSPDWDKWAMCESTEECVVVVGVCGTVEAINQKYVDEYKSYMTYAATISNCSSPDNAKILDKNARICVVKKCAVLAPL